MKRIQLLLVSLVLFSFVHSYAQEETNYFSKKNEINIQVDDVFGGSDYLTWIDYYNYDQSVGMYSIYFTTPSVGIGYKRHIGNGAIRLKFSMATLAQIYSRNDNDDPDIEFAMHRESYSAGWEFHNNMGRTQVFFGADAVLNMQATVAKEYTYIDNSSDERTDKSAKVGFGFKPFLGFKYFISQNFSVSSEYHFLGEFYTSESIHNADEQNETKSKNTGFSSQFGPLGQITFSFHF